MPDAPKKKKRRPAIPTGESFKVWLDAAGRCTFCNELVLENEELGEPVKIGELAHNVGWGDDSPRGADSELTESERQLAENLALACRSCHKPIDDGGVVGRYTVSELAKRKREHEDRIRSLTSIGADRRAYAVRFAGKVRSFDPAMSRESILRATTDAGLYPRRLPGAFWEDIDLDIRGMGDSTFNESESQLVRRQIADLCARVNEGVRTDEIHRVAVFAFGRIPYLVELGARMGDKCPTTIFNRHRSEEQPWTWPSDQTTLELETRVVRDGDHEIAPTLVISLSGSVPLADVEEHTSKSSRIYEIRLAGGVSPNPSAIGSPGDLAAFESELRRFLGRCEADHPGAQQIALFPAVGVAPAFTIGRVLMPDISPAWEVYDRNEDGRFFRALEVPA